MGKNSYNDIAEAIYLSTHGKSGSTLSESLNDIVNFLNRKRLLSKSKYVLEALSKIVDRTEGRIKVRVRTAKSLHPEAKQELSHILQNKYNAKHVEIVEELDEKVIGGMRIQVDDEVIDLTLKNKIGRLQEYLTNA